MRAAWKWSGSNTMSFAWFVASAPWRSRPDKTARQAKVAKKIKRRMKVLFCLSLGLYLRTFREILQTPVGFGKPLACIALRTTWGFHTIIFRLHGKCDGERSGVIARVPSPADWTGKPEEP